MLALEYCKRIIECIEKIRDTQMDAITRAANEIAVRLEKGGLFYVFGTGHSHMLAEEVYRRAGGLIQARAIVPHEITVDLAMRKSTLMERLDGIAEVIFATHKLRSCDVLILVSNSGRNPVPIQMAKEARNRGIFTVALTNLTHSQDVTSREKTGKKLYELCDIVLNTCGPSGDALIPIPGRDYNMAPSSTILGALIVESLVCAIVEAMISHGHEPMIRRSANLDGNDEHNLKIQEQLLAQFPELRDVFTVF